MAIINMLEAAVGPSEDHSPSLAAALGNGDTAYFPAGKYWLRRTIDLVGQKPQVLCDAGAEIHGVAGQPMFRSIASSTHVRMSGGRWSGGSALLVNASGTMEGARFERMHCADFEVAFALESPVHNFAWRDCTFESCEMGLRFTSQANIHSVADCTFLGCDRGMSFESIPANRLQFAAYRCEFQTCGIGIHVDDAAQQAMAIRGCVFERSTQQDVFLRYVPPDSFAASVLIERCRFGEPSAQQTERILASDRVSFRVFDCFAQVDRPGLVFVRTALTDMRYAAWLDRNRLESGAAGYDEALLNMTGAGCPKIIRLPNC